MHVALHTTMRFWNAPLWSFVSFSGVLVQTHSRNGNAFFTPKHWYVHWGLQLHTTEEWLVTICGHRRRRFTWLANYPHLLARHMYYIVFAFCVHGGCFWFIVVCTENGMLSAFLFCSLQCCRKCLWKVLLIFMYAQMFPCPSIFLYFFFFILIWTSTASILKIFYEIALGLCVYLSVSRNLYFHHEHLHELRLPRNHSEAFSKWRIDHFFMRGRWLKQPHRSQVYCSISSLQKGLLFTPLL